jgi:hypothetical protein
MNDEQGWPALAWTLGVLKGLLTGEDVDSRDRGYIIIKGALASHGDHGS